jgi:hypothetical protein
MARAVLGADTKHNITSHASVTEFTDAHLIYTGAVTAAVPQAIWVRQGAVFTRKVWLAHASPVITNAMA